MQQSALNERRFQRSGDGRTPQRWQLGTRDGVEDARRTIRGKIHSSMMLETIETVPSALTQIAQTEAAQG